jgi:hypothetical protein
MPRYRPLAAFMALHLLTACSMADDDHAQGGLTVGENQRLERAAERIDQRTASPAQAASAQFEADVRQRLADERSER